MTQVRKFKAEDLMLLDIQEWQRKPEFEATPEYGIWLEENSYAAYTIFSGDKILSVGGAIELWSGRAEIWHLLDKDCGSFMFAIHKISLRFLDGLPFHRLETGCEIEWPEAHRWLKMLNFEHERTARKYLPSGRDIDIYVRIR